MYSGEGRVLRTFIQGHVRHSLLCGDVYEHDRIHVLHLMYSGILMPQFWDFLPSNMPERLLL